MAESAIVTRLQGTPLIEGRQDDGTLNKSLLDFVWAEARPGWYMMLFVGLGVDFGIQFSVRYRQERFKEPDLRKALMQAGARAGRLSLAAPAARRWCVCGCPHPPKCTSVGAGAVCSAPGQQTAPTSPEASTVMLKRETFGRCKISVQLVLPAAFSRISPSSDWT